MRILIGASDVLSHTGPTYASAFVCVWQITTLKKRGCSFTAAELEVVRDATEELCSRCRCRAVHSGSMARRRPTSFHQRLSAPNVAHNASNPVSAIIPTPHGFFSFHRVRGEVRARVPQMPTYLLVGREKSTRCTASEHDTASPRRLGWRAGREQNSMLKSLCPLRL